MKKTFFLLVVVIAIFSTVFVSCTETSLNDEPGQDTVAIEDGEIDDDDI